MTSGKRDFSKFQAKLEQHIERLPDYAQRAQQTAQRAQKKIQRYLPADSAPRTDGKDNSQDVSVNKQTSITPERTNGTPTTDRTAKPENSPPATNLPVIADWRTSLARWNDPAAKHARRKRRTSSALILWFVLTILCGLYAVVGFSGMIALENAVITAVLASGGAVMFGTFGVQSAVRLRRLSKMEVPESRAPIQLPPARSLARAPMERLAEAETSLAELVRQMSRPGMGAVSESSIVDAKNTAAQAAATLRGLADRIQAIERGRDTAPHSERVALDKALETLRTQLDDGLDGYGSLVAAAGHVVAASSGEMTMSKQALTEATDHLAGLALAYRELS